jgi:hypothetical protein
MQIHYEKIQGDKIMKSYNYCLKCGYKNEYTLKAPEKCNKCTHPFGVMVSIKSPTVTKAAIREVPILNEDDLEIERIFQFPS